MAIAHFTLATRDVPRASRFFESTLGWRPVSRPGNIPRVAAWLAIAPGQELHLVEVTDFAPSPSPMQTISCWVLSLIVT